MNKLPDQTEKFTVNLYKDDIDALRKRAHDDERGVAYHVRQAIKQYVSKIEE